MGGSGGGYFYSKTNPDQIKRKIQQEKEKAVDQQLDNKVQSLINDLLAIINDRDHEGIQRHLNTINDTLEMDIAGTINLRYGGSVSKHTYVDGLSDIDTLAIINNSDLSDKTPNEVKDYFYERLKQRYPATTIQKGDLAVTIKYQDGIEVQILPALMHGDGFKIASAGPGNKWSSIINPKRFALSLRAVNQKISGKLIPTIKIVKSIMADLPERRKLSGYHTEALAISVFSKYSGPRNTKAMSEYFFSNAPSKVLTPITDKTGQSTHVDSYLGSAGSIQRKMVADSLKMIGRKLKNYRYWVDQLR